MGNTNLPAYLQDKIDNKSLTEQDIRENMSLLENIEHIEGYMSPCRAKEFGEILGSNNLQKVLKDHFEVFIYVTHSDHNLFVFSIYYQQGANFEEEFNYAVRNLLYTTALFGGYERTIHVKKEYLKTGESVYKTPYWTKSMNFEVKENVSISELTSKTILKDPHVGYLLSLLNPKYIQRFNQETRYFTHTGMQLFEKMVEFYNSQYGLAILKPIHSYQEFTDFLVYTLEAMHHTCAKYTNLSLLAPFLQEEYPFLFIKEDAPKELKKIYYENPRYFDYSFFSTDKRQCKYFLHLHLENLFDDFPLTIHIPGVVTEEVSFIKYYTSKFGNQAFFDLVFKYGNLLKHLSNTNSILELASETKEVFDKALRNAIYDMLNKSNILYEVIVRNNTTEFIEEHPDIFINYNEIPFENKEAKRNFYHNFYHRLFNFDLFRENPKLIELFKNKNLKFLFIRSRMALDDNHICIYDFLNKLSNEEFLKLLVEYGDFLEAVNYNMRRATLETATYEELTNEIERIITEQCTLGEIEYTDEYCPKFLKNTHPELFLNEDAPAKLKESYYHSATDAPTFTFTFLSKHPEYLPYLKEKSIVGAFVKARFIQNSKDLLIFFENFDNETALKLIVAKPETIKYMLNKGAPLTIKEWYEKTGRKFIPDFTVMEAFPITEIDRFITHGRIWSNLQKITRYANSAEHKDALLRLAYNFGIFHGDTSGLTKLKNLINGVPKTIPFNYATITNQIDMEGNVQEDSEKTIKLPSYEDIKSGQSSFELSKLSIPKLYKILKELLLKEGFPLDKTKPIFFQIYKGATHCERSDSAIEVARTNRLYSSDEGEKTVFVLTLNPQNYPESSNIIRILFEKVSRNFLLTPDTAHKLFGGFSCSYDKDFREFLLANLNTILHDAENGQLISKIQRQFKSFKIINSNRTLTWERAVDYVKENSYYDVEFGNEPVAELSAIAGYSQKEFETLQQIYNYGRKRIFSSIPRIENKVENYTYEILRLDDPLALAIGTLTDCCQEIGNFAETCVEHSMVDKNGRVFVIRDKEGNIISQSWVWRNNNVLCFDNIEIPDKSIERTMQQSQIKDTQKFTDTVFAIYKQAATELIKLDEQRFKELYASGQITPEQYEENRLRNITVGIGYNDIAESIKKHAQKIEKVAHPLPFNPPVPLTRSLWTSDSEIQYLLASTGADIALSEETFAIYSDTFSIYNEDTLTINHLLSLQRLEEITKESAEKIDTSDIKYYSSPLNLIAENYDLNSKNTKVLLNSNLAIIYEEDENNIKIADILYTLSLAEGKIDITNIILMQLHLALTQISQNKTIELQDLNPKQITIYNKALSLTDEIDIERGIKHAR